MPTQAKKQEEEEVDLQEAKPDGNKKFLSILSGKKEEPKPEAPKFKIADPTTSPLKQSGISLGKLMGKK